MEDNDQANVKDNVIISKTPEVKTRTIVGHILFIVVKREGSFESNKCEFHVMAHNTTVLVLIDCINCHETDNNEVIHMLSKNQE